MTKDEIIKTLRDMAKYPTVTLPRDCEALKMAADLLAQPEQEPVAIVDANDEGYWADILPDRSVKVGQHLYTTPPQRKPLTPEQRDTIIHQECRYTSEAATEDHHRLIHAVEAAHNIKENT